MDSNTKIKQQQSRRTRIFRCKYCGSTFGQPEDLIGHKKHQHLAQIIAERKQESEVNMNKDTPRTTNTALEPNAATAQTAEWKNSMDFSQPGGSLSLTGSVPVLEATSAPPICDTTTETDAGSDDDEKANDTEVEDTNDNQTRVGTSSTELTDVSSSQSNPFDTFVCTDPNCQAEFNYDYQLMEHMRIHQGETNPETGMDVNETESLEQKIENDQPHIEPLPPCFVMVSRVDAYQPELLHIPSPHKPFRVARRHKRAGIRIHRYKCQFCVKKFLRGRLCRWHIQTCHAGMLGVNPVQTVSKARFPVPGNPSNATAAGKFQKPKRQRTNASNLYQSKAVCRSAGCNFSTWLRSSMRRHFQIHQIQREISCQLCDASFSIISSKILHMKTCHPNDPNALADVLKAQELLRKEHHREKIRSKPIHGQMYNRSRACRESESVNSGSKNIHPCSECPKLFPSRIAVRYHRGKEHGFGGWCRCDYCPYQSFGACVKAHMRKLHSDSHGDEHRCKYCGASCPSNGFLKHHIASLHEAPEDQSTANLRTFSEMQEVMKGQRIKPKPRHTCDYCPFVGQTPSTVKLHMQTVHYERRRYPCKYCSASYDYPMQLSKHQKVHGNGNECGPSGPMIVSVTGSGSTSSQDRVDYTRKVTPSGSDSEHETEDATFGLKKTAECRICDIVVDASSLRRHQRGSMHLHNETVSRRLNGESPLKLNQSFGGWVSLSKPTCSVCKIVFKSHANLQRHFDKRHGSFTGVKSKTKMKPKQQKPSVAGAPTAIVRSQPFKRPSSSSSSSSVITDYIYKNYSSEEPQQNEDSFADDNSKTDEIMDGTSSKVMVTQQNKAGLKVTSVRLV